MDEGNSASLNEELLMKNPQMQSKNVIFLCQREKESAQY